LPPVFDNHHITVLQFLIENLASLEARGVSWQGKRLPEKVGVRQLAEVTQFARSSGDVQGPFHLIGSRWRGGDRLSRLQPEFSRCLQRHRVCHVGFTNRTGFCDDFRDMRLA